ncbi:MAG: pseudouridine synthase [Verrucomicrobiota bacterium]
MNKPRGYLCTRSDPQHRQVVYDLLPPHLRHLHHVGRLDFHSQGLLILTNSGVLTTTLTHPRHEIEKEYFVTLNQAIEPGLKQAFSKGVRIPGGIARAKSVHIIGPRRCRIILKQGLKRQIREMFAVRGYTVVRLERIRIGQFTAPTLALGKWRVLGPAECALLTAC